MGDGEKRGACITVPGLDRCGEHAGRGERKNNYRQCTETGGGGAEGEGERRGRGKGNGERI